MRAGSHPTACAASSTVALDVSNSSTRASMPRSRKYAFTLSIAIVSPRFPDRLRHQYSAASRNAAKGAPVNRQRAAPPVPNRLYSALVSRCGQKARVFFILMRR